MKVLRTVGRELENISTVWSAVMNTGQDISVRSGRLIKII
jgi:hypothetical protein